jgi:hypothetical protein
MSMIPTELKPFMIGARSRLISAFVVGSGARAGRLLALSLLLIRYLEVFQINVLRVSS